MKASAFLKDTNYASESWLISPVIDLSQLTSTLTFQQAGNFFSDMQADCSVLVSTDRQDWTLLTVEGWPEGNSWTFYDSTADLSACWAEPGIYRLSLYEQRHEGRHLGGKERSGGVTPHIHIIYK